MVDWQGAMSDVGYTEQGPFELLMSADAMWAIHESLAAGFGVKRTRGLGCELEGVDRLVIRADGKGFETRHGNGVEVICVRTEH